MPHQRAILQKAQKTFALMGIVNVTPDSFYDGGNYIGKDGAIAHARELVVHGADILDFGGASSKPGAAVVPPEEEAMRVVPVIEAAAGFFDGPISVDTTWSMVAEAALNAGATWVNDVSAGRMDPGMIPLVKRYGCMAVLMHSRGTAQTMQNEAAYGADIAAEVAGELIAAAENFKRAGVCPGQLLLDPGIGFAKTAEHSIALMRDLDKVVALGYPVVLGTSRKSFIGKITGRNAQDRLYGSLGSIAAGYMSGVRIFRVHDVAATSDFLKVLVECNLTCAERLASTAEVRCEQTHETGRCG